jgi:hypothetical protein
VGIKVPFVGAIGSDITEASHNGDQLSPAFFGIPDLFITV